MILVVTIRSSLKPVMISIVSIVTDPVRRRRDPMINARLSGFSTGKSGGYNANQDPTSISLLDLKKIITKVICIIFFKIMYYFQFPQCSKIRKKVQFQKCKKALFSFSKMAKNQILHQKKVRKLHFW